MKSYRNIAKRDPVSGHWWITTGELVLEIYRYKRYDWDIVGVYRNHESITMYHRLNEKQNVVYPAIEGHFVPSFCSLRAAVKWAWWRCGLIELGKEL